MFACVCVCVWCDVVSVIIREGRRKVLERAGAVARA
jgi:hypothetical protein